MKKNFIINLNNKAWALMLAGLLLSLSVKATVWPIPNTAADTLEHFIELHYGTIWQPGDTIMLSDASEYIVNGTVDIYQEVTLVGDPDLPQRPVLLLLDNGFRPKEDTINLTFGNFNVDGYDPVDEAYAPFFLRMQMGPTYWKNIIIEDIELWGMRGLIDLDQNKHSIYDTIIVNNVFCHDFGPSEFCIDPNINYLKYLSVTNSTFSNLPSGFLKNPDWNGNGDLDVVKEWIIDHNTFYKVGGNNNCILQQNDPDDGSVDLTFTNNIVSSLWDKTNARPFRINELAGDFLIAYSVIHDYDVTEPTKMQFNFDTIVNQDNIDTSNIYRDYPGFLDTAFYNLTISAGNPLLTAGSDGGPIGDPRWVSYETPWVPGPNSHLIPNTSPDTLEHFIEQYYDSIWHDGDTIVLVSNGEYKVNGTVDIYGEVTILGDPRLTNRPIVHLYDNGFRPKEDTINVTIRNLNFNGYDEIDEAYAPFVLRMQMGPTYWKNIMIEDIEAWGMRGLIDLDQNKHSIYDTIIVNNVFCHDFGPSEFCIDPNINYLKYLSVTNSTFSNLPSGFLKNPDWNGNGTLDVQKEWIIDHNTFYKVGGNNNCLLQQNDPDDGSVDLTFTNNIVSKLYDSTNARPFRINELAGDFVIAYSVFNEYVVHDPTKMQFNLDTVANLANVDTMNIYKVDPEFADTTNSDFTIPDDSPLYQAATDGGAIGDPRWAPFATEKAVAITPILEKVIVDWDVQMEVTVKLPDQSVTWSVVDGYGGTSGAATIDANGLLSPIAVGDVKVTATSNYNSAFFDTLIVTIEEQIMVSNITLSSTADEITNAGGFVTLTATIEPGNADDKTIEWTLSDDALATITPQTPTTAELVASYCGTVTVTATAQDGSGVTGTYDIDISGQVLVTSVTVSGQGGVTEITTEGGTLQMEAAVLPEDACNKVVEWSVDDDAIATIDEATGLLTAVSNGTVTVTARATDGSFRSGTADIAISGQPDALNMFGIDELQVLPNPASDFIQIRSDQVVDVTITSMAGAVVMSIEVQPNETMNISELNTGMYIIKLTTNNVSKSIQLIVE